MPTVRLIRHAQASFGAPEYDQLSKLGEQQSTWLGARFSVGTPVGRVVHGGLRRQHDTARIGFSSHSSSEPVHDPGWSEYDEQALMDRYLTPDERPPRGEHTDPESLRAAIDHVVECWVADDSLTGPDSFAAFRARVRQALDEVWEKSPADGETIVVTSAGVISLLVAELYGIPMSHSATLTRVLVNTGVTTLVRGRRGTHVITFNDHAHLEHDRSLVTYR